jgi:hypothetical protein
MHAGSRSAAADLGSLRRPMLHAYGALAALAVTTLHYDNVTLWFFADLRGDRRLKIRTLTVVAENAIC